ncbi:DUF7537 family lipoprotein [Salarchaeum japonicum]|uniref:Uncharacterized protein n=1 Tax=Salarchaeum japonicum TaxID=555573 RepID=A0AAV3SY45_9EURY|nr:hypothetical protein [Salarchaeum japonicum]
MRSPIRRAALVGCVALLLVTAGCSGGTPTSVTETTAPTTSAATTGTTGNVSAEQYPPGVAANGTLVNVSVLLDAHAAATANEPTVLTQRWTNADETVVRSYARGANRTPYYSTFERTADGERVTEAFYGTDAREYVRVTADEETFYSVVQDSFTNTRAWTNDDVFEPRSALHLLLAGGNYSVNGTVERGGRTFVQFTADEPSPANGLYDAYEGTVLVTPDGVVHDIDAATTVNSDGETVRTEHSIALDADAEWSGPPSWVGDVPHLSLSIVADGHAVELRNTGGGALPANTTLRVGASTDPVWGSNPSARAGDVAGTVTTNARLEPGDAVYVTATENGTSFSLHDDPARGDYTFGFAGVSGTQQNVTYRLVTGIKNATAD